MNDAPRTADEILQALLAGDLEATAAEARELFDRDPLAWERWQTLLRLTDRLAAAGDEQRADLADDLDRTPAPGATGVADLVRESTSSASPASAPGSGRSRLLRPLITAAAVLLVALWIWGPDDGAPPAVSVLGPAPGELSPIGVVADYSVFSWDLPRSPGGWFVVTVTDDTDAGRGRTVATSPDLDAPTWTPEHDTTRWPDAILWNVVALDGAGMTVDADGGRARRSAP